MANYPASRGAILTYGLRSGQQNMLITIPLVCTTVLDPIQSTLDIINYAAGALRTALLAMCSDEIFLMGRRVTGMCKGRLIPDTSLEVAGGVAGGETGPPLPGNVAMLAVYYSEDQAALPLRTTVGKQFLPPPPEDQVDGDYVLDGFCAGVVDTFLQATMTFVGGTTGKTYQRCVNRTKIPGDALWTADAVLCRRYLATQRGRIKAWL